MFMLFVEEFMVDLDNLDKRMRCIKDSLGILDDLEALNLKSVKVYHSTDDPRAFRVYYDVERRKDIEALINELNEHPLERLYPKLNLDNYR